MTPLDALILLTLSAIWGASFLFIRVAAPSFGPFALMDTRVAMASVALLGYATLVGRLPNLRPKFWRYLILGAINGAAPFTLIAFAELNLTASMATILNVTSPLFTALLAALWLHDPITPRKVLGLSLGLAGVVVLVGWSPLPLTGTIVVSACASLLAALAYAAGSVYAKAMFAGVPPLTLAIGQQLGATIVLLPFALVSLPTAVPPASAIWSLFALALVSTSIAYLLYFRLISTIGPASTLTIGYVIPIFGVVWGATFLHEPIVPSMLIAMLIIMVSVLLVTGIALRPATQKAIAPPGSGIPEKTI